MVGISVNTLDYFVDKGNYDITPVLNICWNRIVRTGARSLSNLRGRDSGPVALWGFSLCRSFMTPGVVNVISGQGGYGDCPRFGTSVNLSFVKACLASLPYPGLLQEFRRWYIGLVHRCTPFCSFDVTPKAFDAYILVCCSSRSPIKSWIYFSWVHLKTFVVAFPCARYVAHALAVFLSFAFFKSLFLRCMCI